jgi:hypothetical protein
MQETKHHSEYTLPYDIKSATIQNQRYIHVGDGSVDYGISYFLCRFRCFCSIIYKFIYTSIPDHEDLAAFQLLLPSKD